MHERGTCILQSDHGDAKVALSLSYLSSFSSSSMPVNAVVIGASGGIGNAFVNLLSQDPMVGTIHALSRSGLVFDDPKVESDKIDIENEGAVEKAALHVAERGGCDLILVATGILHNDSNGQGPERDWRHIDADWLAKVYRINTVGPILCAKHFLPLFPKDDRSIFAAISARVGSVSDNRLGGWYGYRASKAALNQCIQTLSIELARKNKQAICVGLHPGTVDTNLSKPFQRGVPKEKLFSPETSARYLLSVIDGLSVADSGKLFAWNGDVIPP